MEHIIEGFAFGVTLSLLVVTWLSPVLIAWRRRHASRMAILAVWALLWWTGIGWFWALIWSLTGNVPKREEE